MASGVGPTKIMSFVSATAGKLDIFRQEAVTGVYRIHLVELGNRNDLFDIQVRFERFVILTDLVGLVGLVTMRREPVLLGDTR